MQYQVFSYSELFLVVYGAVILTAGDTQSRPWGIAQNKLHSPTVCWLSAHSSPTNPDHVPLSQEARAEIAKEMKILRDTLS